MEPASEASAGQEAVELAATAGLVLDEWQRFALEVALGERSDGQWAAFEVAIVVPRQNGKGSILEARELAGLFLFGEELILHSAHEFKTAAEAFRRVLGLIEGCDDLSKRVSRVRTSHGEEGIELRTGQRLRFVARSTGSGRGFSGDCVILDESYQLGAESMAALLPTLSARPNPQLWYTSSAPLSTSEQLHAVRRRALDGGDGALAYMEWSVGDDALDWDRDGWAQANPALGYRIDQDYIERERAALPAEAFRRERLGVPDVPLGDGEPVLSMREWESCADKDSSVEGTATFALDVTPDRAWTSIAAAGKRADGVGHVELVDHRAGTHWVTQRIVELLARWGKRPVTIDPSSAAGSLIGELERAGVEVYAVTAREHAQACGQLFDAVANGQVRHLGQAKLTAAVAGARKRALGDAWAWSRQNSAVDISPLVACTLALWSSVGAKSAGTPLVAWR